MRFLFLVVTASFLLSSSSKLLAQDLKAVAIMEAVAESRTSLRNLHYLLEVNYGDKKTRREFLIKESGERQFVFEKVFFENEQVEEKYSLRNNNEQYEFTKGQTQVELFSVSKSESQPSISFFSPLILGISSALSILESPRGCLGLNDKSNLVLKKTDLDSVVLIASRPDKTREWKIRPNSLQVISYRTESEIDKNFVLKTQVDSKYHSEKSVLPSDVQIITDRNGEIELMQVKVKDLGTCSESDFELKTLEIPIGTQLMDNRIPRYSGYWNGTKFVDNLAQVSRETPKSGFWRSYGTSIVVLLVAFFVTFLVLRKTKK